MENGNIGILPRRARRFRYCVRRSVVGSLGGRNSTLFTPAAQLPRSVDFSNYPATALNREWFLTAEPAEPVARGQAMLELEFQLAPGHYPLMQAASFAPPKAEFNKGRTARCGVATPSNKPTIGVMGTSPMAAATTVGASNAVGVAVGPPFQHRQITLTVRQPFANLIPTPGLPSLLYSSQ